MGNHWGQILHMNILRQYFTFLFIKGNWPEKLGVFSIMIPGGNLGQIGWGGKFYKENNINHSQKPQCCNKQAT